MYVGRVLITAENQDKAEDSVPEVDISILITAHYRKQFILSAVKSVLSQNTEGFTYEIIVVKNYKDALIDTFLKDNKVVSITTNAETLGAKLAEGLKKSNGNIISFLEDDDIFLPNKLKTVLELFKADSSLMYLHNAAEEYHISSGYTGKQVMTMGDDITYYGPLSFKNILEVFKNGGHGNNSCISLRINAAKELIPRLEKLNVTCDGFIFLWCSQYEKKIRFTDRSLTRYTVHESFTHRKAANINDYITSNLEKALIMFHDKEIGLEMINSVKLKNGISLAAEYILLKELLNLNLFSPNKLIGLQQIVSYFYLNVKGRRYTSLLGTIVHLISLVSKKFAITLVYHFQPYRPV